MEVYLHDLGLSSEFLEIKKNKQKINLTYQNLKLLESWIWKVSSKIIHKFILLGTPAPGWELYYPQLSVWDWNLYYSSEQILQFHNRGYDPEHCPDSWLPRQQASFMVPGLPSFVWLFFSRGVLTPLNQLCPWDGHSLLPASSRWLPRPAISSESLVDQDWGAPLMLGTHTPRAVAAWMSVTQIRLWRRYYLRGRPDVQMGLSAPTVSGLQDELSHLPGVIKK